MKKNNIEKGGNMEGISTNFFIFDSLTKTHTQHHRIK